MTDVTLPSDWTPRPWQRDVMVALEDGKRRAAIAVHRRAGKTDLALNLAAIAAHQRVGQYLHVFPHLTQARLAVWRGADRQGRRFIERAFPESLVLQARDQEMSIEFKNGSVWKLAGADNPSSLVGANPVGVILDEAALYPDAEILDLLRPILAENGGWLYAISTFRGRNWFYDLHAMASHDPAWYAPRLTVDDTSEWDGRPLVSQEAIEADRKSGMNETWLRSEYWLDVTAAFSGAYYAPMITQARADSRIGDFPYDPQRPVHVAFDLGFSDATVAVFFQTQEPDKITIIGSNWWTFTPAPEVMQRIQGMYPWGRSLTTCVLPHDGHRAGPDGTSWASLASQFQFANTVHVLRKGQDTLHAEIAMVQQKLSRCYIDESVRPWTDGKPNNSKLLDALAGYRTERKESGAYAKMPYHSWESNGADAVRYAFAYRYGPYGLGGWQTTLNYSKLDRAYV